MSVKIEIQNGEELQEMMDKRDFRIVKAIVEGILKNIKGRKKTVHVLSITCLEEGEIYDISVDRKHFVETLMENLKYYEKRELYEDCNKIIEAVNTFKNK
jgi:hypothetical protein